MTTPWGPIGYITLKRTYSRRLKENDLDSPTEEFSDIVERIVKACDKQLNVGFTKEEEEELRSIILSLKGIVAGRFLWQLGTKTVDKLGLLSLQNCAATVVNEPIRPFTWAMDALMLGSGVGYNIQREYVYELPKVKKVKIIRQDTNDADFIVPDSREGWVELLRRTLEAHFITGKGFSFSSICIRGKGTPIKGFGGTASGPEDLCWGILEISKVLNARAGKKVRPIDCLDIMNIIGAIVVAGNVRRSAQIAIGDMDDLQFLNAKRWDLGNIPNWRAMSNNSVVCNDISLLPEQFWNGYLGNGEPYGLINLNLARAVGRKGETKYPDPEVCGFNPCVTGDTEILTSEGYKRIDSLLDNPVEIWNGFEWSTVQPKVTGHNQEMLKVTFSDGRTLTCTKYHKFHLKSQQVEAKDLILGDQLIDWVTPEGINVTDIEVTKIEDAGIAETVYCFNEPKRHLGIFNGVITGQCAEQSLAPYETCCLAEIYLPNIQSYEEFIKVAKYLYRINKHSLALDCHLQETKEIVHKNMRMGIGVTGYLQATEKQRSWLSQAYEELRKFDKEYSAEKGFPTSIKLTTVKPSGTLSLLAGVTPGAHPAYSQYYIRRVRMASNIPLVEVCRQKGYPIEFQRNFDGTEDKNTVVVSFPCSVPEGTKLAKDMSAIDQLEVIKSLQENWSDNAVSVTIYYRKEELPEIKQWLAKNYNNSLKTVSFLLHNEHGFIQAPMEEISKEQYKEMKSKTMPVDSLASIDEKSVVNDGECVSGVCPIK